MPYPAREAANASIAEKPRPSTKGRPNPQAEGKIRSTKDRVHKTGRGGMPRRAPFLKLAGPGAGNALKAKPIKLSGRSQRGDSAWNKTLDHLLSLLMGNPL